MCRTSSPPRRDLYELSTELAADKGGFFVPENRPRIRIGAHHEARRAQIYNANYMADGTKYADYTKPWTAFTSIDFRAFKTHPEALQWVLQEARK
jgi:hypothetical protein